MTDKATFTAALTAARDQYGRSLAELSQMAPTLVVFLRHFG
ncbi:MAG: hypothetical protein ACKVZH_05940 [Blastocatellia bacterium]